MTAHSPARRLLLGSALACLLLAMQNAESARADGGRGGVTGGSGAADKPTGAGNKGSSGITNSGGGGGAGTTGGDGGNSRLLGGDGGTAAVGGVGGSGADGANSTSTFGGSGGGGGAHGFVGAGAPTQATSGGNGGNGGSSTNNASSGGGGGGAGGYGAVVTGGSGAIGFAATGGNGGNGGSHRATTGAAGGSGGRGVMFTAAGSFSVDAAVSGGAGGSRSTGATAGAFGAGGVGIFATGSADLTLGSNAIVTGGLSGDGVTRANAITLSGTTNRLELQGGAAVVGNVIASGTSRFVLGGATAGTFDISQLSATGQYQNFARFDKIASSAWTLTGTSTYAGPININGGTLAVNGDVRSASILNVNSDGTLGGNGTVGDVMMYGGRLAPGNSIGTLNVAGNLTFASDSIYALEVSPSNADRVNVTGIATLSGAAVQASFANGSYISKQYTILNATGGVSGTFGSQVNTNLPANFTSKLSYDANNAYLNLTLNFVPTPTPAPTPDPIPPAPTAPSFGNGLSSNQNAVGNTLVDYFNSNGGIPLAFGALTPAGLTQVSGETNVGTQQPGFTAATQFVGAMSDPTVAGRGAGAPGPVAFAGEGDPMNAYAYAANGRKRSGSERDAYAAITKAVPRAQSFVPHWSLWVSGFGGTQTTDGNAAGGTSTSTSRIAGAAVGADYWLSPQTVAGFALAGGATNYSVVGGGSGRSDLVQLGGFIRHEIGASYITASAAYGWQSVNTDRAVGAEQLRAKFDTNSYTARLESGHRFAMPSFGGIGLTPYAAAQVTYLDLPAYAETAASGTSTFALAYAAQGITAPRTELGLRSDKSFVINDAVLILRGRAAWAHDYNTQRSASATFQSLPGASFVVNGARPAANAALTTAEAEWRFASGISVGATFEGEFSDVTRSYAGKGVVRYTW